MRMLYDLQLSVVDGYRDGRFLFHTDSNVDVASTALRGIAKIRPDWELVVPVPPLDQIVDGRRNFHGDLPANVKLVTQEAFGDPFVGRQSFDARSLLWGLDHAQATDVDYVYTNDPCRALAYKTFFHRVTGRFVPVASRWHWVTGRADRKVPEPVDFAVSQGEGAIVSDVCYFDSRYAVEEFLGNMHEHFNYGTIDAVAEKCKTGVAVDVDKIDAVHPGHAPVDPSLLILWAHRLSYYTGWEQVFDALAQLWNRRPGSFRVIATDPGGKHDQRELARRWPFIEPLEKNGYPYLGVNDYLRLCWRASVVIGNHTVPAIWGGLALTEPMAAWTAPLMPNRWAYREMCTDEMAPHVLFEDMPDMIRKLERLIDDPPLRNELGFRAWKFCRDQLSPARYVETIVADAERLVAR